MNKEDLERKNLIEGLVSNQAEAISYSIKALAALFGFGLLLGTNNADKTVEGFLDIIKSEVKDTVGYRSAKFQEKRKSVNEY